MSRPAWLTNTKGRAALHAAEDQKPRSLRVRSDVAYGTNKIVWHRAIKGGGESSVDLHIGTVSVSGTPALTETTQVDRPNITDGNGWWSPDNRFIAFNSAPAGGTFDIWIWDRRPRRPAT